MNGTQIIDTSCSNDTSRREPGPSDKLQRLTGGFMHPTDVVRDLWLTHMEKREVLASWASDVRAVPGAPGLRQLDNGAGVRVDDVLRALKAIDDGERLNQRTLDLFRSFPDRRMRLRRRRKSPLWRSRSDDDDDDPPPCPAVIGGPLAGPLCGGGTADPCLTSAVAA